MLHEIAAQADDPAALRGPAPLLTERERFFRTSRNVCSHVPLMDAWKRQFPNLPLTVVGKITNEPGLRLHDRNGVKTLTAHGYTHFAQS